MSQMKKLLEIIEESAKTDDLDYAIRPIQDALGQTDGGPAALFWQDKVDFWHNDTFENRVSYLADYVKFEINWHEYNENEAAC